MKKRLLSTVLVLALLGALCVPVCAAEAVDNRLARVTAQVKTTLQLNTDDYDKFYGDLMEDVLAPSWYLEWNGDGRSISVNATETGKVLSYHCYEAVEQPVANSFAPSFPAGSQTAARGAAEKFLGRVLTRNETFTMEAQPVRLDTTVYRFSGEILLNGLPAGLSYSISVRCEDNAVTSFSRGDLNGRVMNTVPSSRAAVSADKARAALRETLALRLEYVLEGENKAVLRYLPEYGDEYYVDAATGKLVNLTELTREIMTDGVGNTATKEEAAAAAPSLNGALSKAEQEGADRLKDVLSREELDRKARAITALGLEAYTLSGADYTVPREEGEEQVTATLSYGRQVNGASWRRTVVLDAKSGELISVYSSGRWNGAEEARTVDVAAAEKIAEAFLKEQTAQFGKTALYSSSDAQENARSAFHSFTYVQKENGYFFPESSLTVGVDATDGSISAYSNNFRNGVAFDAPDGILGADQALEAWLNTYTVQLGYVRVPVAVDYSRPEYKALADYGISYLYQLKLGYTLEREEYLLGIDAKTGAPVDPGWTTQTEGISYNDLAGHWAQEKIEELARYSVGYAGGGFQPDKALTQVDLVALLASTRGYLYNGENPDDLYEYAYGLGILRREDRQDGAVLSRIDTVKVILDATGYESVARLQGIYRTKFADDSQIPADRYGYAALAQGLGVVEGDGANRFLPRASATRAQAAVMLYNLMSR